MILTFYNIELIFIN